MDSQQEAADLLKLSGPLIVGYLLSWGLFGVLSVQVYIYYLAFPEDKKYTKILVASVYCLEVVQTILVARDSFVTFAQGFGDPKAVTDVHFAWLTMPLMSGLVGCIVQCSYAHRIGILSKSRIIPMVVRVMGVIQLAAAFLVGIKSYMAGDLTKLISTPFIIGQGIRDGFSAACDVLIAVYMSYFLSRAKAEILRRSTRTILTRVIKLAVGGGALTAAFALADLILYLCDYKHGAYFVGPCITLGKLYSNSMMVLLNSRLDLSASGRQKSADSTGIIFPLTFLKSETRDNKPSNCSHNGSSDNDRATSLEVIPEAYIDHEKDIEAAPAPSNLKVDSQ